MKKNKTLDWIIGIIAFLSAISLTFSCGNIFRVIGYIGMTITLLYVIMRNTIEFIKNKYNK